MSVRLSEPENGSARCGILVIGSLLWDTDAEGYRDRWRQSRLDLAAKQHVRIPIRYGRKSHSWGGSFTMIFDAEASSGQAVLVPCKAPISTFDGLMEEVRSLWSAEARQPVSNQFHSNWGCVCIMFGTSDLAQALEVKWGEAFQKAAAVALPLVTDTGRLDLPWPTMTGGADVADFDVILATATMPLPKDSRPDAQQIAQAWLDQSGGHERYFFENVRHGIRTHDDQEIWSMISAGRPSWQASENYKLAVNLLKSE